MPSTKGWNLGYPGDSSGLFLQNSGASVSLMSAEIARRQWTIMVIDDDNVFYLGDHPMVLQLTENPGAAAELGFDIQGIEAFLPLTPKCALYMPCVSIGREIVLGYDNALSVLRDSTVASTNPQLRPLSRTHHPKYKTTLSSTNRRRRIGRYSRECRKPKFFTVLLGTYSSILKSPRFCLCTASVSRLATVSKSSQNPDCNVGTARAAVGINVGGR